VDARNGARKGVGRDFFGTEVAVREREPDEAEGFCFLPGPVDREKRRIGFLRQERRFREGSRRHDARHLALDHAFARRSHLFDDDDAFAEPHELRNVGVERNKRDSRHRNGRSVGELAALRERDADQAVGADGIVEEGFVEVSHPKEHERFRVAVLHLNELPH